MHELLPGVYVGGLLEIVAASGAEVWAHRDDAGVIDGPSGRGLRRVSRRLA